MRIPIAVMLVPCLLLVPIVGRTACPTTVWNQKVNTVTNLGHHGVFLKRGSSTNYMVAAALPCGNYLDMYTYSTSHTQLNSRELRYVDDSDFSFLDVGSVGYMSSVAKWAHDWVRLCDNVPFAEILTSSLGVSVANFQVISDDVLDSQLASSSSRTYEAYMALGTGGYSGPFLKAYSSTGSSLLSTPFRIYSPDSFVLGDQVSIDAFYSSTQGADVIAVGYILNGVVRVAVMKLTGVAPNYSVTKLEFDRPVTIQYLPGDNVPSGGASYVDVAISGNYITVTWEEDDPNVAGEDPHVFLQVFPLTGSAISNVIDLSAYGDTQRVPTVTASYPYVGLGFWGVSDDVGFPVGGVFEITVSGGVPSIAEHDMSPQYLTFYGNDNPAYPFGVDIFTDSCGDDPVLGTAFNTSHSSVPESDEDFLHRTFMAF